MGRVIFWVNPNDPSASNDNTGLSPWHLGGTDGPIKDWNAIFDATGSPAARAAVATEWAAGNEVLVGIVGRLHPGNQTARPVINNTGSWNAPANRPLVVFGTDDPLGTIPDFAYDDEWDGELTTRTSNTAGVVTLPAGHPYEAGDVVTLMFTGGYRCAVLVADATATTVTLSGGSGSNLPSEGAQLSLTQVARAIIDGGGTWDYALNDAAACPNNIVFANLAFTGASGANGHGCRIQSTSTSGIAFVNCRAWNNQRWGFLTQDIGGVTTHRCRSSDNNSGETGNGGGFYGLRFSDCEAKRNKGRGFHVLARQARALLTRSRSWGQYGTTGAGVHVEYNTTAGAGYPCDVEDMVVDGNVSGITIGDASMTTGAVYAGGLAIRRSLITNNSLYGIRGAHGTLAIHELAGCHFDGNGTAVSQARALFNRGESIGDPRYEDRTRGRFALSAKSAAERPGSVGPGGSVPLARRAFAPPTIGG
ncbi:MAG: hypothetical protein IPM64_17170 [Phycisphaerales bacterium]|nr:hypothetical protein [Phycisphaerales bacterium]